MSGNVTNPSSAPLLLNSRQAADALAISPRKLWEISASREIPTVRIGRTVRYDPRDLVAYIDRMKSVRT